MVEVTLDHDEGPRPDATLGKLLALKPTIEGGTTTARDASQLSDGAAAVMLMDVDLAARRNLPALGLFRSMQLVAVAPEEMGIAITPAIRKLFRHHKLGVGDVDIRGSCVKPMPSPHSAIWRSSRPHGGPPMQREARSRLAILMACRGFAIWAPRFSSFGTAASTRPSQRCAAQAAWRQPGFWRNESYFAASSGNMRGRSNSASRVWKPRAIAWRVRRCISGSLAN